MKYNNQKIKLEIWNKKMKLKFFILIIILWRKNIKKKIINKNKEIRCKIKTKKVIYKKKKKNK